MIWDFLESLFIRENESDRSEMFDDMISYGRVKAAFLIQKYDFTLRELATFIHRNEDVEMHDEKGTIILTMSSRTPPSIDDAVS